MTTALAVLIVAPVVAIGAELVDRHLKRARLRRTRILMFVTREGDADGWVTSRDVAGIFGPSTYPTLRSLVRRGVLERREGPTSTDVLAVRGGRHRFWYRIKRDRP